VGGTQVRAHLPARLERRPLRARRREPRVGALARRSEPSAHCVADAGGGRSRDLGVLAAVWRVSGAGRRAVGDERRGWAGAWSGGHRVGDGGPGGSWGDHPALERCLGQHAVGGRTASGLAYLIIAFGEELALRGVAFWAIARSAGNAVAVLATGGVFGALHLLNPSATWLAAGIVALVGVWFGVLTARTGSLWCAIGLHLSWNFCEGFVFGQPVSGLRPGLSLLSGTVGAAGFWNGGDFGPEAAGWTAVLPPRRGQLAERTLAGCETASRFV
jgi:hypothetical protein